MDNIDVRKYIINNFKEDSIEDIEKSISSSIESKSEDPLIGLGVLFELMWNNSSNDISYSFARAIKLSVSGEDSALSHLEIACGDMFNAFASCSCVTHFALRSSEMFFAIVMSLISTHLYSFLFRLYITTARKSITFQETASTVG